MNVRSLDRRFWLPLALVLLSGCDNVQPRIDGHQFVKVPNLDQEKHVVLALRKHKSCASSSPECEASVKQIAALEGKFASCLNTGIKRTAPNAELLDNWSSPLDREELIAHLGDKHKIEVVGYDRKKQPVAVHYLVTMAVADSESRKQTQVDGNVYYPEQGGTFPVPPVVLWGVGQQWTKTTYITAQIYETTSGQLAAEIGARLSKEASWMLPMIYIIPLPPVGWVPNVERSTCTEMGEAVGRFLTGAGNAFVDESPLPQLQFSVPLKQLKTRRY